MVRMIALIIMLVSLITLMKPTVRSVEGTLTCIEDLPARFTARTKTVSKMGCYVMKRMIVVTTRTSRPVLSVTTEK